MNMLGGNMRTIVCFVVDCDMVSLVTSWLALMDATSFSQVSFTIQDCEQY